MGMAGGGATKTHPQAPSNLTSSFMLEPLFINSKARHRSVQLRKSSKLLTKDTFTRNICLSFM